MFPGVSTDLLMHRQIHSSKRQLLAQAKQKLDWWVQGRLPRWKEAGHLENNRNWVGIKERLWGHEAPGKAGGRGWSVGRCLGCLGSICFSSKPSASHWVFVQQRKDFLPSSLSRTFRVQL